MVPISDYAVIGDGRSAALVSRRGSIDWLCWPRFDSPSVFGALLGEGAGRWRIAPVAPTRVERRYVDGTNVLETRFHTDEGSLCLTDVMPVASEEEKRTRLLPEHEILRLIGCERGEVDVEMIVEPRPGYGRGRARFREAGKHGLRIETAGGLVMLRTDVPLEPAGDTIVARIRLRAGETRHCSLTLAHDGPAILPPLGDWSREAVARSNAWWRQWSDRLRYEGPGREAVIRSALALKLLVYAPSGAVVAAPTTSLPEWIGGDGNWDYRFCWLRDAALTTRALFGLGCRDEALAFVSWVLHTTRLTRPELRPLYDVYGCRPRPERTLDHLTGYRQSRPVRVGNAATEHLQLDVYGEVVEAVSLLVRAGETLDRETRRMLRAFGEYVCAHWREPDEGIWEPRSGRSHNTHSRVLCWTALDRLLELNAAGQLPHVAVADLERHRFAIRREVEGRGWSDARGSYVAQLDGQDVDAALLLLAWYGFEDAGSGRMTSTYARIRERLGARGDLLYRYRIGEAPHEGAFGICSFWGAEYLALGGGTTEEAQASFDRLLQYQNDVGLFAEEIDPETGEALGNFPQAFTHIGLINAALSLSARREGRGRPAP